METISIYCANVYPTFIGFGLLMIYYNLGSGTTAIIFNDQNSRSTSKSGMTNKYTEREQMLNHHVECLSISRHKESEESYEKAIAFPNSENERRAASHTAQVF